MPETTNSPTPFVAMPAGRDSWWAGLKARLGKAGRLGPFSLLFLALPAISGIMILGSMDAIGDWLRGHQDAGYLLFVGATAVLGAAGVLPTAMLCLLGGWAFGFGGGTVAAYLGILLATVAGHALATWLAGDRLLRAIDDAPKARGIRNALARGSTWQTTGVITLIRISPLFPFAFTNLMLAAARVRVPAFVMGTALGLLPRSTALTYIGSQAKTLSDGPVDDPLLTWVGIAASAASVIALGLMARRVVLRIGESDRTHLAQDVNAHDPGL